MLVLCRYHCADGFLDKSDNVFSIVASETVIQAYSSLNGFDNEDVWLDSDVMIQI